MSEHGPPPRREVGGIATDPAAVLRKRLSLPVDLDLSGIVDDPYIDALAGGHGWDHPLTLWHAGLALGFSERKLRSLTLLQPCHLSFTAKERKRLAISSWLHGPPSGEALPRRARAPETYESLSTSWGWTTWLVSGELGVGRDGLPRVADSVTVLRPGTRFRPFSPSSRMPSLILTVALLATIISGVMLAAAPSLTWVVFLAASLAVSAATFYGRVDWLHRKGITVYDDEGKSSGSDHWALLTQVIAGVDELQRRDLLDGDSDHQMVWEAAGDSDASNIIALELQHAVWKAREVELINEKLDRAARIQPEQPEPVQPTVPRKPASLDRLTALTGDLDREIAARRAGLEVLRKIDGE